MVAIHTTGVTARAHTLDTDTDAGSPRRHPARPLLAAAARLTPHPEQPHHHPDAPSTQRRHRISDSGRHRHTPDPTLRLCIGASAKKPR
ncbi:MAG TPA: hypothetical protein VFY45_17430 [Baekduia sp.]|nr:hypothetical protein [Baekduia sp.]